MQEADAEAENQRAITTAVEEIVAHRAVIEQAKGMVMLVFDIDANAAFEALRWRSQNCNVKLRAIAERVVVEFRQLEKVGARRTEYERAMLTIHERV